MEFVSVLKLREAAINLFSDPRAESLCGTGIRGLQRAGGGGGEICGDISFTISATPVSATLAPHLKSFGLHLILKFSSLSQPIFSLDFLGATPKVEISCGAKISKCGGAL